MGGRKQARGEETPTDWSDLPSFSAEEFDAFYDEESSANKNTDVTLDDDRRFVRRARERNFLELLNVKNAAKHLEKLPAAGETIHAIMRGNYNAWDLVPAVLKLASPATVETLWVATLGFNQRNADELLQLIDRGQVGAVHFICSHFYRSMTGNLFDFLSYQLGRRGQRICAIRCHAKILAFALTDGRRLVVESSANLRSCNNIEQFAFTHDAALFDFHTGWMEKVIAESAALAAAATAPECTTLHHSAPECTTLHHSAPRRTADAGKKTKADRSKKAPRKPGKAKARGKPRAKARRRDPDRPQAPRRARP